MENIAYINTPVCLLKITQLGEYITGIYKAESVPADFVKNDTPLLEESISQLEEYFAGKRKYFELPLAFNGTEFQNKVWNALCEIPYGETRSYKQLAVMVDSPKGFRAVGMANNKNPFLIVVPCHRVIGADGSLVGYGAGLDVKQRLLEMEQQNSII